MGVTKPALWLPSTPQVAQVVGAGQRKIIDWCERGIILADIQSAAGFASRREFSYAGILQAALAFALQEKFGISRDFIKSIVKLSWFRNFFSDWSENKISGFLLITNPHNSEDSTWLFLSGENRKLAFNTASWLTKGAESALIIDLEPIKKKVDAKIAEMG
jgi:hypothetical protein